MDNSSKSREGGLAIYVNDSWCNSKYITVKVCKPNNELLTVGLQPYCMPWKFLHAICLFHYAPPSADAPATKEQMHSVVSELITNYPNNAFIAEKSLKILLMYPTPPQLTSFWNIVQETTGHLLYPKVKEAYMFAAHTLTQI